MRLKLPRKHVSHYSWAINTSWPFVTSAWPWPVLTISIKRTQALPLYFGSIYGDLGALLLSQVGWVLRTENAETLNAFDLWPDLDLDTWPFKKNFKNCFRTVSPRPFQRRLARLAAVIGLGVSLGGALLRPPPGQCAFGWRPRWERGLSHVTNNRFFEFFENFDITFFLQLMTIEMTYMIDDVRS